jgi:putative membrane protein
LPRQPRDAGRIQLDMKSLIVRLAVMLGAMFPMGSTLAQSTPPGTNGVPTSQNGNLSDRTIAVLRAVGSSNLFEIESSRLALAHSQSNAIKEFADRMVGDHTRAANQTRQVLGELGASAPPAMLEPARQQQLDALKAVASQAFDTAYLEAQYTAHVEAIAVVREYARTGDSERLKKVAADVLPMLQSHLDHVTRLRDRR